MLVQLIFFWGFTVRILICDGYTKVLGDLGLLMCPASAVESEVRDAGFRA